MRSRLPLLVAAAFALGVLYNLYRIAAGQAPPRVHLNLAAGAAVAGLLVAWHLHARAEAAATARLLRWLREHEAALGAGGAHLGDVLVTARTPVRQYPLCLSFLLLSVESRTRPLLGDGRQPAALSGCALGTLLGGWWALPLGPYRTFATLLLIARGGYRGTVADLMRGHGLLPDPDAPAPVSAAGGLLRGALVGLGIVGSWLLVVLCVLWLSQERVVFIDNGGDGLVQVTVDGRDVGAVAPGAHLRVPTAAGEHRIALRHEGGRREEDRFTVPPLGDPLRSFRGLYNIGGRARYALVTRCYGDGCAAEDEVLPLAPPGRFFPFPEEVSARADLDAPFPAAVGRRSGRPVQTHLCHQRADRSVGCPLP